MSTQGGLSMYYQIKEILTPCSRRTLKTECRGSALCGRHESGDMGAETESFDMVIDMDMDPSEVLKQKHCELFF